jgi:hypothetical protein
MPGRLTLKCQPRHDQGTFGAHHAAICPEPTRTAEISAAGQTTFQAHRRWPRRTHETRPTGQSALCTPLAPQGLVFSAIGPSHGRDDQCSPEPCALVAVTTLLVRGLGIRSHQRRHAGRQRRRRARRHRASHQTRPCRHPRPASALPHAAMTRGCATVRNDSAPIASRRRVRAG